MLKKSTLPIAISILLFAFTCGKQGTYTIEIKDGVSYVHNHAPLWGDTVKVALEFVQKIGDIDAEDENYFFNQPVDCTRDDDGNIYILDWGDENIKKYDAQGTFITTFGKRGQGPGEFIKPAGIDSDSESNIYVSDAGNNRIQIFSADGKYKDMYRLSSYSSKNCVLSSGYFIVRSSSDLATGSTMLRKLDAEGNTLKKFGKPITYSEPIINEGANSIFLENDNDDNIYITFEYENRIDKYNSDGELLWTIDRPLNFNVKHKRESRW